MGFKKLIKFIVLLTAHYLLLSFFIGCSYKDKMIQSKSALIIFKTKQMRFADYGFITKYSDHINLKILEAGVVVLNLDVYKNKICKENSYLRCQDAKKFNAQNLLVDYKADFLYNLLNKDRIFFKDKKNKILIKIKAQLKH